jgi:RsiW-degrading membrane proteinase PrsW (M82 family)
MNVTDVLYLGEAMPASLGFRTNEDNAYYANDFLVSKGNHEQNIVSFLFVRNVRAIYGWEFVDVRFVEYCTVLVLVLLRSSC